MDLRTERYAQRLAGLIQKETITAVDSADKTKFYQFHELLRETFPNVFSVCEWENFNGSFLMRWKGKTDAEPILIMNHQDVVEAPGTWKYPPFSGTIAEGRIWGRGTLDTKGGLWAMFEAANELIAEGFVPGRDVYFMSTCTEECDGTGADLISKTLEQRGIRFRFVLDEGGMIVHNPIAGANGEFAMVGVGEKGCMDLQFIARSAGGHASTPEKDTPLVRLGKFMAAVEKKRLFKTYLSPTVCEMLSRIGGSMRGVSGFIFRHAKRFKSLLAKLIPSVSSAAGAMLKTTIAFTMASGSEGANVLPQEAWVVGNLRYSHHQGGEDSLRAVQKLAAKYGIETVIIEDGFSSPISDYRSEAFAFIERAIGQIFPTVITTPYVTMSASDCRYMSRVSENCFRFTPFVIDDEQFDSIHGINENVALSALAPAVDFYRYIMKEV